MGWWFPLDVFFDVTERRIEVQERERAADEEDNDDNDKFTTPTAESNCTFTAHKWPIHQLQRTT